MIMIKSVALHDHKGLSISSIIITLLIVFLMIFPKGGVKLEGIPLTFGYMLFAVVAIAATILNFVQGRLSSLTKPQIAILAAMGCFQCVVSLTLIENGYTDKGFLIALLISLFFIPIALIYFLLPQLKKLNLDLLLSLIRLSVSVVSIYGICLFIYKTITGDYIEIPFLTVNADDVGFMDEKYNNRGDGIFKLISTYNNGNIYGVSLLIVLPLFCLIESSLLKRMIVKFSLVLTLSRTVWIGLVVFELLSHRDLSVKKGTDRLLGLIILGFIIYLCLELMGQKMDFIFDKDLGGRIDQFQQFSFSVTSNKTFEAISEIVPLSMLDQFGLIGLLTFLTYMLMPVIVWFMGLVPYHRSAYKKSLAMGLLIYCIIMFSDGAISYIPVMMFYWVIVALLLTPNMPLRYLCAPNVTE